jgi:hypothetical protein
MKIKSIPDFTKKLVSNKNYPKYQIFSKEKKNQLSGLLVLTNSRTTSFLGPFSQVEFQNFEYLFLKKKFIYFSNKK